MPPSTRSLKVLSLVKLKTLLMASTICYSLFLSLSGSFIDKFFIVIGTFGIKWQKRPFFHKVHFSVKQIFKVVPHAEKFQTNRL